MGLSVSLLILTATTTVYVGSKLSAGNRLMPLEPQELEDTQLTLGQALVIPVSSSICLLLLFFFFAYLQYILMGTVVLVGSSALCQLTNLALQNSCFRTGSKLALVISLCGTFVAIINWITTGNLVVYNLLGCSLCIVFISTLRFPSLKIAVICLSLLVVYDIFWVFCSEYFFEKNVMVEVATKVASNPAFEVGKYFQWELFKYISPTLELPMKLMFPNFATGRYIMLGLGDIALPGALVAYSLRCDMELIREKEEDRMDYVESGEAAALLNGSTTNKTQTTLFNTTLGGYFVGLVAAFVGNTLSGHPQPALIYLVPGVIGTLVWKAWHIGKFNEVWQGPMKIHQSA